MKNIILIVKGFVIGIGNIIPGVSGGTLSITLGIYQQLIGAISHFFSNLKENIKFLLPLGIGMAIAILTMSNIISAGFDNFPIPTTLFFIGLVIGGIPMILSKAIDGKSNKQISNYVVALITFSIVMIMVFFDIIFESGIGEVNLYNLDLLGYVTLFVVGIIAAATMVIPGVSGSLVLMLLGYYLPIISVIKSLTKFDNLFSNLIVAVVFGFGILVGVVLISKLIEFLFQKYEKKTYFAVLGFIISSVIAIPISVYNELGNIVFDIPQIILGIILLVIGIIIGNRLGDK